MANISKLSTQITASADQFNIVLDQVEKRYQSVAKLADKANKVGDKSTGLAAPTANTAAQKTYETYGKLGAAARTATAPVTSLLEGMLKLSNGSIWRNISSGVESFKKLGDRETLKSFTRQLSGLASYSNVGRAVGAGFGLVASAAKLAVVPVVALVGSLAYLTVKAINQGVAYRNAARDVGESSAQYTRYATALKLLGASAEDTKQSLLNLANSISEAKLGDKIKLDTFKNLGVDLKVKSVVDTQNVDRFIGRVDKFNPVIGVSAKVDTKQLDTVAAKVDNLSGSFTVMPKVDITPLNALESKLSAVAPAMRVAVTADTSAAQTAATNISKLTPTINVATKVDTSGVAEAVGKLNDSTPVEVFTQVAEKFRDMGSDSEKAYNAYKLFGDKAATVLPLLSMQKAEFDGMIKKADVLGNIMGTKEANAAQALSMRFAELKEQLIGIGTKIATALMPVAIALFEAFNKILNSGVDLSGVFKTVGNVAVTVIGFMYNGFIRVMQAVNLIKIAIQSVVIVALRMARGVVEAFKYISDAMGDISPFGEMTETLDGLTKSIEGYREARDAAASRIDELEKQTLSVEDMRKAINDAGDSMQKFAQSAQKGDGALAQLAARKKLFEEALRVESENITPLESFNSEIVKLNVMLEEGVLKWETYGRAVSKAVDALENANNIGNIALPTAVKQGSSDAVSALARSRVEQEFKGRNPQERVEAILVQSQTIQAQTRYFTQQTAEALRNRQPVKVQ